MFGQIMRCPPCNGQPIVPVPTLDLALFKSLADSYHVHAGKCDGTTKIRHKDGTKEVRECVMCKDIKQKFSEFPTLALSHALQEPSSMKRRFSIAAVALDNLINLETLCTDKAAAGRRNSKRSRADFMAGMGVLAQYEKAGGTL
jgi:hypothetical protein